MRSQTRLGATHHPRRFGGERLSSLCVCVLLASGLNGRYVCRYLAGGWQIRGRLFSSIFPYLILAGVFVAFLKVQSQILDLHTAVASSPFGWVPDSFNFVAYASRSTVEL